MFRTCIICGANGDIVFTSSILNKYDVKFYRCKKCEAIYTEKPYWLDEAYTEAITTMDTGVMVRNVSIIDSVDIILKSAFNNKNKNSVIGIDYAGGYGILTRMLRDRGYNFYWYDKYAKNEVAKGYEYNKSIKNVDVITAFEVFEHLDAPLLDIEWMVNKKPSILIFSTLTYDGKNVPEKDWWYWCFEHGQHIILYSKKTLQYIGQKFGYTYVSLDTGLHMYIGENLEKRKIQFIRHRYKIDLLLKKMKNKLYNVFFKDYSLTKSDFFEQRSRNE